MSLYLYFQEALANIRSSKLRSLLTLLGVLVGTASVVALVSSGQLATQHALAQFKTLGTDLLAVSVQTAPPAGGQAGSDQQQQGLSMSGVNTLAQSVPAILYAAPYTLGFSSVSYKGQSLNGGVIGVTQDLAQVVKIYVQSGRFISDLDQNAFYGVVGDKMTQQLAKLGVLDPIGAQIKVGQWLFTVVGTLKPWPENMFMYADINNSVLIPLSTALLLSKNSAINDVVFKIQKDSDIDQVETGITQALDKQLGTPQLFFRSAKQIIESMQKQQQTFTLMLGSIGGISLLVGGIGVMNIMLVSVIERRREIGVRMAVGAKRKNIQMMFLTEAIVLTLFGGILGVLLGIGSSFAIAEFSKWEFTLFLLPPAIGFLVSVLVGIFFGFYPAFKASRLDPIQTLRAD